MTDMTSDQKVRIQILNICEGRVSEAKQAYYWVMGEQNSTKTPITAGLSPQQAREAAAQQRVAQALTASQNDSAPMNARNPHA